MTPKHTTTEAVTHAFVVAPAGVAEKERPSFATVYARALAEADLAQPAPAQGSLFAA